MILTFCFKEVILICRNHYICSVLAARIMVPRKQGLIVNISSIGGLTFLFNVPYGIGKEAVSIIMINLLTVGLLW